MPDCRVSGLMGELQLSGSPCPNAPTGFSEQGPAGNLCQVEYPDGTKTFFYYSANTSAGQLMRIVDPGNEVTDFSYTAGRLSRVADPTQTEWNRVSVARASTRRSTTTHAVEDHRSSLPLPTAPMASIPRQPSIALGTRTTIQGRSHHPVAVSRAWWWVVRAR